MENELRAILIAVIEAYVAAADRKESTVGMKVARDARFLTRLRDGKPFTVKTYDSAMQWFSDNWPDGKSWPAEIDRPAPTPAKVAAE